MRIQRYNLDVIFRRVLPEMIINSIVNSDNGVDSKKIVNYKSISKDIFINLSRCLDTGFSKDEREEQYKLLCADMKKGFSNTESVFNLLYNFASKVLTTDRFIPRCKYDSILKWQDTTHKLGQDIFTTIYLAKKDSEVNTSTEVFSWDPIIKTDNKRLYNMLQEGIAENHYHLNGSSQSFPINWALIMNNPNAILYVDCLGDNLQNAFSYGADYNVSNWKTRLFWAAYIRWYLFKRIHCNNISSTDKNTLIDILNTSNDKWMQVKNSELIRKINTLRFEYGYKAKYDNFILDYAIFKTLHPKNLSYNRILVGERKFMYDCFYKINLDEFDDFEQNIFYLYLLIKSNFRSEFIQVNEDVGFKNFSDYQDRKEFFYENKLYKDYSDEALRISLNSVLALQPIKKLEARITPKLTPIELFNKIIYTDRVYKHFEDFLQGVDSSPLQKEKVSNRRGNQKYFFVLHYPKSKYIVNDKREPNFCRNFDVRKRNKQYTRAIIHALGTNEYLRDAVLGIDACANEIGCRPETFAVDFRCLRVVIPQKKKSVFNQNEKPVQLSLTYHAGEDFLNLVDGLRAIDESVNFLNMKQGDRLGHALALGIDVNQYYESKNYRVIMSKQDALDDDIWLLNRSLELNIPIEIGLERRLLYNIQERLNYIYGDAAKQGEIILDQYNYFCSWKLRGDAPELYSKGYFDNNRNKSLFLRYDGHMVNDALQDKTIRYNRNAVYLYYAYHYDLKTKERGFETDVINIDESYIELVNKIQKKMQFEIADKGIMIECNPSSNYLISTFNRYDMHPITEFNNMDLEFSDDKKYKSAQLSVSINTDDQGVFDTSLINEYALMASALENKKDMNGNKLYSASQVYKYLDSVRKMGLEQSF